MTPAELAVLVSALGGLSGLAAMFKALRSGVPKRIRVESTAIKTLVEERDQARQERDRAALSEREAWDRADAMERRYDLMTAARNSWRERSHRQDAWVIAYCTPPDATYPAKVEDPPL